MNYYNEHDPKAAAWLRELIARGHIAPGVVDERSIEDIAPSELTQYTQCHFFAGIGGWSLALRLAGWPDDRPVWTGSCPCQPFSTAGKGKGVADERHLWPAFKWLISKCQPPVVFGEQVASKDGREWLAGVRADLEDLDFAVGAADLCAAGIGAPHIRQRLYWMAHARSQPKGRQLLGPGEGTRQTGEWTSDQLGGSGCACRLVLADSAGWEPGRLTTSPAGHRGAAESASDACGMGDTRCQRVEFGRGAGDVGRSASQEQGEAQERQRGWDANSDAGSNDPWIAYDLTYCRDGKARRIPAITQSNFLLLADGFWYSMADVRTIFFAQVSQEITRYATLTRTDPDQILRLVQESTDPSSIPKREAGGQNRFLEAEILLPFLRDISSTYNNISAIEVCGTEKSTEFDTVTLRNLRDTIEAECSSYRRESSEQFPDESPTSLRPLSFFLARCGKACGYQQSRQDAANFPLSNKTTGRVMALRGFGNAIVPQVASEFIQACEEALNSTL